MFHSFTYPDEAYDNNTHNTLTSNFCPITMIDGLISFVEPKDCKIKHKIGIYSIKNLKKKTLLMLINYMKYIKKRG